MEHALQPIHRRGSQDIIRNPPGTRLPHAINTELDAFMLFVTEEMLYMILRETNREARRIYTAWNAEHTDSPKEMTEVRGKEEKSSLFGFCENLTLASYVPKKGKVVVMLSTMHHDTTVEGDDRKPHIIMHYNACKGGVDTMDKLATTYSCKRKCNRWPLALFSNLMDVAAIAAFIIWIFNKPQDRERVRRSFLIQLGKSLAQNCIAQRLENPKALQKGAKLSLVSLGYLQKEEDETSNDKESVKRKRCVICPRNADRKVRQVCAVCERNVCKDHSTPGIMCSDCL